MLQLLSHPPLPHHYHHPHYPRNLMDTMDSSQQQHSTPPHSRSSSSGSSRPNLSLDLSDLPPLSQPPQPSNTLLITNLQNPQIFTAATLDQIRRLLEEHAPGHTLNSFSPLKSLQRLIVSLPDTDSAIAIRSAIDGMNLFGNRVRVYFGEPTPIQGADGAQHAKHLAAPQAAKQFFISPPPSPPAGWTMREEDPPNKQVHADDLVTALTNLGASKAQVETVEDSVMATYPSPISADADDYRAKALSSRQRSGSTTIVFNPEDHGRSPDLPAIAVEDTTATPADLSPVEASAEDQLEGEPQKKIFAHTARPPVELMES